ncbi:protein of unknown function [Evansella caseinilytica]|uniref:IrrE N-terminal-like domain-containing protein n=1 Tax=Evansella caseinilytica TaxID=1503961 RepID=A0A1H3TP35_9BACI|nr:ImmA/IrrE family metallo-endopeptidase [Evansella caseinilytica]SDZ51099.1 protein of unknown function [Evansella caseinilytica]
MYNTLTESWVVKEYKKRQLTSVKDLAMKHVADAFQIGLVYHQFRSNSIYETDFGIIYINNMLPLAQQRVEFFHELGHVLKHFGDQEAMSSSFIKLQEDQAERFSLYAAMPLHILESFVQTGTTTKHLADSFELPENFVSARMEQLKRLYIRRSNYFRYKNAEETANSKRQSYDPEKWTAETRRIMNQLKSQVNEEVVNYVGLLRRD